MPYTSPCTLRIDPATGMKGPVHSEAPAEGNTYNQNFQNRFCGCGEIYDAHEEKGTMFQCLGLAMEKDGGCGEDWWHPECLVGPGRRSAKEEQSKLKPEISPSEALEEDNVDPAAPMALGFPHEDDFDTFICYKCAEANPWIKRYVETEGFLPPVYKIEMTTALPASTRAATHPDCEPVEQIQSLNDAPQESKETLATPPASTQQSAELSVTSKKRKSDESADDSKSETSDPKKIKLTSSHLPYHECLPPIPSQVFSIFLREDFRSHFCRCPACYPALSKHPQLLEEEESYEPPLSENGDEGGESVGTGSLLDRGEAALSNVDRVRAIGKLYFYFQSMSRKSWNLSSTTLHRRRDGLQPPQRQSKKLSATIRRKRASGWRGRHKSLFREAERR